VNIKEFVRESGVEAPATFWEMDEATIAMIVGGCGPRGFGDKIVPDSIFWLSIKASCIVHDLEYEIGTIILSKIIADNRFRKNMKYLIEKNSKYNWVKKLRLYFAEKYYFVVHEFGTDSFYNKTTIPKENKGTAKWQTAMASH